MSDVVRDVASEVASEVASGAVSGAGSVRHRMYARAATHLAPPLAVIVLIIGIWWVVVVQTESAIFPTPWQVAAGAFELVQDGTLWEHIGASLYRVGAGFGLALLLAVPLGLWMGWVGGAYRTLNPVFQMLRPISPIAWIPLAILWFGVGDLSPMFLIFISSVFPMIVQTTSGVHTIDRRYLRAAANFGVSRAVLFRQVVIPAVLPEIIVGMRIGIGVAWLVVVAAEMIALRSGLAWMRAGLQWSWRISRAPCGGSGASEQAAPQVDGGGLAHEGGADMGGVGGL